MKPHLENGILPFFKSANLTIEEQGEDIEVACEYYRAHWNELADRSIQITKIERDDARYGKPTYWVVDVLSRREVDQLERTIQRQLREDRAPRPWTAADEWDSRRKEA